MCVSISVYSFIQEIKKGCNSLIVHVYDPYVFCVFHMHMFVLDIKAK